MRKLCHQIESRGRDVGFNNIPNIVPDVPPNDIFALLAAQADEKKVIVADNSSDTGEPTLSNDIVNISQKEKEEAASGKVSTDKASLRERVQDLVRKLLLWVCQLSVLKARKV